MNLSASIFYKIFSIRLWRSLIRINIDRIKGLDFESVVIPEMSGLNPQKSFRYSPSGDHLLRSVLDFMNITADDAIIDIGAGKGSAMRLMSQFPFSIVAGIELSAQLASIARTNFRLLNIPVEVYDGDASEYMGYGRFNIFYLYNPFPAKIIEATIEKIVMGNNKDRELIVIYNNPTCSDNFIQNAFVLHARFPGKSGNWINLYSNRALGMSRLDILGTDL